MRHLVVIALLSIAACTEPDPVATATAFAPQMVPPPCEGYDCNLNGSNFGAYIFHELQETGVRNSAGLMLDGLWKFGLRYQPHVVDDRLTATHPFMAPLNGALLTGSYLRLVDADDGEWRIYIEHVSNTLLFWTFPEDGTVETYRLRYVAPGAGFASRRGFCNDPPLPTDVDGGTWSVFDEAFLFSGDRYDASAKTVIPTTAASRWFNIACAGSVLAKVHLYAYSVAATTPAHTTSWEERNDLFAMYTGNVCGDGTSYTVPRTPIRWTGSNGWHPLDYPSAPTAPEAVWGDGRAQCLDTFRIPANQPGITCAAELPLCDELDGAWTDHGTVLSGVP